MSEPKPKRPRKFKSDEIVVSDSDISDAESVASDASFGDPSSDPEDIKQLVKKRGDEDEEDADDEPDTEPEEDDSDQDDKSGDDENEFVLDDMVECDEIRYICPDHKDALWVLKDITVSITGSDITDCSIVFTLLSTQGLGSKDIDIVEVLSTNDKGAIDTLLDTLYNDYTGKSRESLRTLGRAFDTVCKHYKYMDTHMVLLYELLLRISGREHAILQFLVDFPKMALRFVLKTKSACADLYCLVADKRQDKHKKLITELLDAIKENAQLRAPEIIKNKLFNAQQDVLKHISPGVDTTELRCDNFLASVKAMIKT